MLIDGDNFAHLALLTFHSMFYELKLELETQTKTRYFASQSITRILYFVTLKVG